MDVGNSDMNYLLYICLVCFFFFQLIVCFVIFVLYSENKKDLLVCLCFFCSVFLGNIKDVFIKNFNFQNLLLDDFFKNVIYNCQVGYII